MEQPQESGTNDEIEFKQIFAMLWRGKWIILFCTIISIMGGRYYANEVAVAKYAATSRLVLQSGQQQVVDIQSVVGGDPPNQVTINTELAIIKSRRLLERLVVEMDLVKDPEFNGALREPAAFSRATIQAYVREKLSEFLPIPAPEARPEAPKATPEEVVIRTAAAVRGAVFVSSERATRLLDVRVTSQDRRKSAEMANRLAQIYLDDELEVKFSATEYAINWLSDRVSELELELNKKEDEIKSLRSETELVSLEALEALNIRSKDLRERVSVAEAGAIILIGDLENLQELAVERNVDDILAVVSDPSLSRFASGARAQETIASQAFFNRFDTIIANKEREMERAISQRDALESSYIRIQQQITEQNADLTQLNQLTREANATRILYETFLTRLKEASVQIGLQQSDSRIMSLALPGTQIAPRRSRIMALSFILGVMLGSGIILLRYVLQNGFRTEGELAQTTGLLVLGESPTIKMRARKKFLNYLLENTTSAYAEAIRNLRTSILMSNIDVPPKVIMVTSSIPGEGKTSHSIALAHNLSGLGKKVLLVEGDIRRNTLNEYFQTGSKENILSILVDGKAIEEATHTDSTVGIDVLMGGKSKLNAANVFSSDAFERFLEEARSKYDYIVIDTPPVVVVPDSRIIGRYVDAIIYVVKWDSTQKELVKKGVRQFTSIGLNVSGMILSQINPRGMKRYGYGGKYGGNAAYGSGYYDT